MSERGLFADFLDTYLKNKRISYTEVAKATGASIGAVSRWCDGKTREPGAQSLLSLAEFLGLDYARLTATVAGHPVGGAKPYDVPPHDVVRKDIEDILRKSRLYGSEDVEAMLTELDKRDRMKRST